MQGGDSYICKREAEDCMLGYLLGCVDMPMACVFLGGNVGIPDQENFKFAFGAI